MKNFYISSSASSAPTIAAASLVSLSEILGMPYFFLVIRNFLANSKVTGSCV